MDRNMEVKNNVDDMIFQVLNYIDHTKLSTDEVTVLVYEILSTIVVWQCDFNPENIDMKSLTFQVTNICKKLNIAILESIEEQIKLYGYRETGE